MEFYSRQSFDTIALTLTILCLYLISVSSIPIPNSIQHLHIKNAGGEPIGRVRRSTADEIISHNHKIYDDYLITRLGRAEFLQQQARNIRDRVRRNVLPKRNPEFQNADWLYDPDRVRRVVTSNQILKEGSSSTRASNARPIVASNEIRKDQFSSNNYQGQSSSVVPGGRTNSPAPAATNTTSPSVYVVSGVSKYSVLHVVPPNGIQVHEIRPYDDHQPQQQQPRLLLGTTSMSMMKRTSGGGDGGSLSGSNKTGLAIVLIEFDVSDDEDYTYETMLETVE